MANVQQIALRDLIWEHVVGAPDCVAGEKISQIAMKINLNRWCPTTLRVEEVEHDSTDCETVPRRGQGEAY